MIKFHLLINCLCKNGDWIEKYLCKTIIFSSEDHGLTGASTYQNIQRQYAISKKNLKPLLYIHSYKQPSSET